MNDFQKYEHSVLDVIATLNSEQKGTLEGLFPEERMRLVAWLRWRVGDGVWDTCAYNRRRERIDDHIRELARLILDAEGV